MIIRNQEKVKNGNRMNKMTEENDLWEDGSFAETLGSIDIKQKMKTFHMKHDEDMSYDCIKCNKKISAHNLDWHNHMCDDCFNKEYLKEV